jgi:hypothetical protein
MGISLKGKNGWITFEEGVAEESDCLGKKVVLLQLFSRVKPWRNLAPVCIEGPKTEVEVLLLDLLEKVRAIP